MLDSFPAAAGVGLVLGFLSGLGIGGGSLLILWLTLVLGMDTAAARGINLLFFLPAAGAACLFHQGRGKARLGSAAPGIAAGCIAAAFFSQVCQGMETDLLRRLFGGLLLITGLRELFFAGKKRP